MSTPVQEHADMDTEVNVGGGVDSSTNTLAPSAVSPARLRNQDVTAPVHNATHAARKVKGCETCLDKSHILRFRSGFTCVYREKGRPGLRPGYGKSIEHRLALLENNMEKMNQSVQDVLSHVRTTSIEANTSLHTPDSGASVARPASDSQSTTTGHAPLWETWQQLPDVTSLASSPMAERLPPAPNMLTINMAESGLPPMEVLQELVDLFFEMIYPWVPLFYKPSFIANLFAPDRQILLHAIVVIAFRFWREPEPSVEVRDSYVKVSRDRILLKTIDTCSVISTQALALLALDALSQGPGPRTWNIMSMLVTTVRHLSLAKSFPSPSAETTTPLVRNEDPDDDLNLSIIETEEKRRLFWVVYSLDRFSSVSHGQPGGTDTKNIKLPYPANDADWGQAVMPEWFQLSSPSKPMHINCGSNLWHHYIDLLALMDRTNLLLIQPFNFSLPAHCQEWQSNFRRLDSNLSTWFESLPREVRESPASFNAMWVLAHATFHLISIRMYTVAAFPSTTSPYLPPSSSARGRCRRAVREVASLTASLQPREISQLGPMFAFVVWVAARSMVILWTTGYENSYGSTPKDLETLMTGLQQLALCWPCAQRYINIIQLILDTKNNPGGPTGLDIFNDTRRTAYGLQSRLGTVPGHPITEIYSHPFDFLDVSSFDISDLTTPWGGTFGSEIESDWL
ncbi:fungal-specific transcription factor domain-containing protein [Xylogone sp. PMI_703]|nr:fungal-specific transcription factor domain-containing protein [Xylogone sp. PMI_703]